MDNKQDTTGYALIFCQSNSCLFLLLSSAYTIFKQKTKKNPTPIFYTLQIKISMKKTAINKKY